MSVFFDSSALVKLYGDEPDSGVVRTRTDVVVSALARVEVPAAIWRKQRTGELGLSDAQTLVAAFEADYFGAADGRPRFVAVVVAAAVLDAAAALCRVHGLRAHDAVQLATASTVRATHASLDTFAAFDAGLRTAAGAEGFTLLPRD